MVVRFEIALVTVWATATLCGLAARKVGQAPVVGHIVAGLLLGPSGLGPKASDEFFSADTKVILKGLAGLGLNLYMYDVGLVFDVRRILPNIRKIAALAGMSFAIPALLAACSAEALLTQDGFKEDAATVTAFVLALGSGFACSALPVAVMILSDLSLLDSDIGRTCVGAATLVTVLQFVLLALAKAAVDEVKAGELAVAVAKCIFSLAALVVGLVLAHVAAERLKVFGPRTSTEPVPASLQVLCFVLMTLTATATDEIGFTSLPGALMFGAAMPFDERLRKELAKPFQTFNAMLLLPIFLVASGLATNLREVKPSMLVGILVVVIVGTLSKLVVGPLCTKLLAMSFTDATVLSVLLNCRGLFVLVVNLEAFDEGIFDVGTQTSLVLLALVSTIMTGPSVKYLLARQTSLNRPSLIGEDSKATKELPTDGGGLTEADYHNDL